MKCFCRDPKFKSKKIPRDVIEDVFHLKKKSDEFAESVIPVTYDFVKNHLKNITVEKCEEELDGEIFLLKEKFIVTSHGDGRRYKRE